MNCGCNLNRTNRPMRLRFVVILALLGAGPILGGVLYLRGEEECCSCSALASTEVVPLAQLSGTTAWSRLSASRLDGSPFRMSDLVGKPVILDFWATWCPPCRQQREVLRKLAGEYGERLRIVALSVDEDPAALRRFLKDHPGTTHELFASAELLGRFEVDALPTLIFIDTQGHVRHISAGLMDAAELKRTLAPILK